MYYNLKNILCSSALALLLSLASTSLAQAQGIVTLADDASDSDMDPAFSKDIPDEISLFEENVEVVESQVVVPSGPTPIRANQPPQVAIEESEAVMSSQTVEEPAMSLPSRSVEEGPSLLGSFSSGGIGALSAVGGEIDDEVFSQMSDLEKQTALLNLELRREKVKNDIEAIKNQRLLAIEQEKDKKEEKARKKIEWEKAQEQKIIQEQQKLRELDLSFEKLRQEKLLKSYKNQMLGDNQKWIANNAELYKQMQDLKKEKQSILDDSKQKFDALKNSAANVRGMVQEAKNSYERDIADLQTQISILKARIEAQEREMEKQNPFAEGGEEAGAEQANKAAISAPVEKVVKLSDMYAVMEIRGQGGELIAKLINQDGAPFYVKKGTALQSGHIIDDITSTYVRADKSGSKDFLYFSSGGILLQEPIKSEIMPNLKDSMLDSGMNEMEPRTFISSDGVPGLGKDMMVR